jgi:hypothetical protein
MNRGLLFIGILLGATIVACGDDKGGGSTSSSGGGTSSGSSGETTSGGGGALGTDAGSSGASGTPAPKTIGAPQITELMKMTGSLHVMWKLPKDTECDKIEAERKSATEPYKAVWSTPGDVDNKHDGTATADTTYTYRLRCKVGSDYSGYSNEMSKNPKQ